MAAIRDGPTDLIDADSGEKICTVKAGPRTHINELKKLIETDTGIPILQISILAGTYRYKDFDQIGGELFTKAFEEQVTPQLLFRRLSEDQANEELERHKAIEQVKKGLHIQKLADVHKADPEVVLFAIQNTNASELQHASDSVKNNRDAMIEALKSSSLCVVYIGEDLWQDRDFIKGAMAVDGLILGATQVPFKWRCDPEIVMYACESHGYALKHASEEIKNNRSIVLAAVNQRGTALMYASEEMRMDYDVVMDAVRQNRMAIVHAKGDLREDDDIRAAAGQGPTDKMMDHEKLDKIKAKFHELDANGDGFLSYDELAELLKKGNPEMNDDEIRLLFDQMDTHKDDKVDFHEFCDYIFGDE